MNTRSQGRTLPCGFFFFNDTATTEIYTLSLHDALPISCDSADYCSGDSSNCTDDAYAPDTTPCGPMDNDNKCIQSWWCSDGRCTAAALVTCRSEERRVGKECRCGWARYHYEEKRKEGGW